MSDDAVLLTIEDDVATVTLNRPDVRNALAEETSERLIERFDTIADSDARCVVLEGAGPAFCAGGDVGAMVEGVAGDQPPAERVELVVSAIHGAIEAVHDCRLPVVAKIDGATFGAGAGLALACDVQLASPEAKIGFGFRRVGLAIDSGVSYFLPRLVGPNKAKELVFTGELLDADTARELGIFTRLFEADEFEDGVENMVETIAEGPTVALTQAKRLLDRGTESTFEQALDDEATAQGLAFTTADHEEGATAFMEQRSPEFEGR
ncbi:enoyl-CoA hydratase/isomerase family protein [Halomicroarcula sp. F13]|uniref:Enoyl-CoA hydratase/isomerase family protein n=1 Tax=Haloarcula rubra TaxID=2487747 RepID=A0AAW4PQS3_9EURY|nr:enoyl-CoA hydratase-related protein [Halomicroarcula rubra]MBX0323343.1 enoyl-CoA hydratase/isomerase family protein [Halomicroarcula rubra]